MEIMQLIVATSIIVAGILLVGYLNKRFELGLEDSSLGGCTLTNGANYSNRLAEKDKIIKNLSERVAVLEKLVTDPQEQLKKEIDSL
ncbi:hypothetical protein Q4493_12420 [Colwellia sp. 1_MG-2023]|uniref:hypothetical protein n=1 Tax=Colwellia sp. 1_MG-2023 TaxID=3062649 RepID=UPI0026E427CE|nr:hypothetical protein [Colwellia sp. 1_MG-2023]MDO6446580.1 hypothetical protein [Colwellia sp. 1_MG-2023]